MIKALKAAGIKKCYDDWSGDRTAKVIAAKVGVDEYHAEVLPEDKAAFVEKKKSRRKKSYYDRRWTSVSPALFIC